MIALASQTAAAEAASAVPMLRVLVYQFFPGGGIGRYSHELANHLAQQPGVDVELVCLPSFEWRGVGEYRQWPHLFEIGHARPWLRKARFLAGQLVNPRRLAAHAAARRADIVHLSNINHLTCALWMPALRRLGVKVVATAHDVRRAKAILSRRYETRQLARFYRQADGLFVHSTAQAEDLTAFAGVGPEHIHVVPHGPYDYGRPTGTADELRARYGLPTDRQIALFFGQLRDEKNLDVLLRALAAQPSLRERVHLVVAGRGGGRHRSMSDYQRLANELRLGSTVTWMDRRVPDPEVADLFTLADWVALPYSRTFSSQSGVLNVAAAYRRPVLVSATATLRETLGQCDIGVLCEPDDVESLASAVEAMCRRVAGGYDHAFDAYHARFGWAENARRTIGVYRALCTPSATPGMLA